jgi:hypothetical protein
MMVGANFLAAILGQQGADVLQKAADCLPDLEAIIVPRTVIAYLETAQRVSYEGEIPGTDAYMEKGELVIGDDRYDMGADFLGAASALTLAVAGDIRIPETLDPRRVARLCKGVAALSKAKFLARIRVLEDSARGSGDSSSTDSNSVSVSNGKVSISISETSAAAEDSASGLEKDAGMPGKAAPPGEPKLPTPPIAQKKAAGIGGKPNTALTRSEVFQKSELMKSCKTCGQTQLRGRQMVGCLCCCDVVLGEGVVVKAEDQRYTVIGPDVAITTIEDLIRR